MLILRGEVKSTTAIMAIVCSTFSIVNRYTSQRDELTPEGATFKTSVRSANKMVARCSLLIMLLATLEMNFVLENPSQSIIVAFPRLRWAFKALRTAGMKATQRF